MKILDDYLQYLTETKWKRKVETGELSPQAVAKIKEKGLAKSAEDYRAGIEKGSDEIIRKNKGVVKSGTFSSNILGPHTKLTKPEIHLPSKGSKAWLGLEKEKEYVKRHEADELRTTKRLAKKYKGPQATQFIRKSSEFDFNPQVVGKHASADVLKKELKYSNFSNALYNDMQKIREYRGKSGEYDLVKNMTKKNIKKIERFTGKLRSAKSPIEKKIVNIKLNAVRKFLTYLINLLKKFTGKKLKLSTITYVAKKV